MATFGSPTMSSNSQIPSRPLADNVKDKISLDIAIVGAGIGGLAAATMCTRAGMKVTVYEAASELNETGVGLIIGPNMSRILHYCGVLDMMHLEAVALKGFSLRRYADDSELAQISLINVEKACGTHLLAAHRADVQKALIAGAEAAGVRIELKSRIEDIDFKNTRIKIDCCSDWLQKDVIIAADGIKSTIRRKMLALHRDEGKMRETGDAAWRVLISAEKIYKSKDVDLIEMLESPIASRWIGPDGHIMCYPIKNHTLLNVAFIHPQKPSVSESWTTKTDKKEMHNFYGNWNPRVKKLLDFVADGEILEWKLHDHDQLVTWIEGKVALLGDAAHPMLPYIAQGAAQAVEDAAVLTVCLSMIDSKDQVNMALQVYELMRKERTEIVQASAAQLRETLHLHDGEKQQDRDSIIRNEIGEGPNPDPWSDKSFLDWCWGTDVQQQAVDMWNQLAEVVSNRQKFESPCNTAGLSWLQHFSTR